MSDQAEFTSENHPDNLLTRSELLFDLKETEEDIEICQMALSQGVITYSGGLVADRLEANIRIKARIEYLLKQFSS